MKNEAPGPSVVRDGDVAHQGEGHIHVGVDVHTRRHVAHNLGHSHEPVVGVFRELRDDGDCLVEAQA